MALDSPRHPKLHPDKMDGIFVVETGFFTVILSHFQHPIYVPHTSSQLNLWMDQVINNQWNEMFHSFGKFNFMKRNFEFEMISAIYWGLFTELMFQGKFSNINDRQQRPAPGTVPRSIIPADKSAVKITVNLYSFSGLSYWEAMGHSWVILEDFYGLDI